MSEQDNKAIRACALELLASVSNEPYINKERLFSDAMAYYRWQLTEREVDEALDLYMHEFKAHHGALVKPLRLDVWCACFVTWFVEQGFHKLPPLCGFDAQDELMLNTRFSSPSFRLPTGDPTETYLIQWVHWHLDNPLASGTLPNYVQLQFARWAWQMVGELPGSYAGDRARLLKQAERFFCWARFSLRSWNQFMDYISSFLYSDHAWSSSLSDDARFDAAFIQWFCMQMLNHGEKSCVNGKTLKQLGLPSNEL